MKLSDLMKLSTSQLESMSVSDLRSSAKSAAQALNRRYVNIKYNARTSKQAVRYMEKTGGRFSLRGKSNKNALILEVKRMQTFFKKESSTVKGAREEQRKIENRLFGQDAEKIARKRGLKGREIVDYIRYVNKKIQELWDAYHNYQDINQLQSSTSLISEVQETARKGIESPEDIDNMIEYLKNLGDDWEDESLHIDAGWNSNVWKGNA